MIDKILNCNDEGKRRIGFGIRILSSLYAIVLFYFNYIRLSNENLWIDEAFTANIIRCSIPDLLARTAADVHPPFYYFIVKAFCSVFGQTAFKMRFVSIIPLVIFLIFSLTVIWKKFGPDVALILMTLTSVSDVALRYNVEIRMYSWVALFVFMSYYYVYKIIVESGTTRDYILFSIFSLMASYTHYYALIAVAFFYAVLFIRNIFFTKTEIKQILAVCVVAVVAYLPWLLVLIKSLTSRINNYWIAEYSSISECYNYIFSNHFNVLVWIIVAILFVLFIIYELKAIHSDLVVFVAIGLLSATGTMAVGIIVSKLVSPFFVTRYTYVVCPVVWLILGIVISKMKFRIAWTAAFLILSIYTLIPSYKTIYYTDNDYNNRAVFVIDTINQLQDNDRIITNFSDPTIPDYYFYGKDYVSIPDLNQVVLENVSDATYWFIVGDEWSYEDIVERVGQQGFSCEMVLDQGMMGHGKAFIYKCNKL